MKPQLLISLCCMLLAINATAQDAPRKFKNPVPMCPIDYGVLSTLGITPTSLATVKQVTSTQTLATGQPLPKNALLTGANTAMITDTVFLYTIISQSGMAFNMIDQVGSFTVIKLWPYKSRGKGRVQVSEYDVVKEEINTPGSVKKFSARIQKPRSLTQSQKDTIIAKDNSVDTSNLEVDPTKDFYLVRTADLLARSEEFEYKQDSWNVGLMFLPVKVRPFATTSGVFDFTSDINVGTSFSWTVRHDFVHGWNWNLLAYVGLSTVKVDSTISGDPKFTGPAQNYTTFSPALGMYWEKKNVQLGFAIGMDFLAGPLQKTWVYRGMPWFSIAAGINLFKLTTNTNNKTGKNE
jgi:hypothetical protein